ncbi:hypothetical protein KDL27_06620 [Pseudomonas syringae pv. syringae]|uniref:Uncharacterized protein n=1 Tax=Pseudomonas syringae pv. syringae TaxID=321 RepID=A0AB35JKS3_PSESY|nr:hypothetical protein [Pseudomonas syringae]MDC3735452.1 hypothetical protein [Pseudomonas syringae pv. syringae]
MDKLLLTAFLTALAGFITAALSIVKLVNEKESKTTEYRQAWTDSVRGALAELIAKINSQASTITGARHNGLKLDKFLKDGPGDSEYEKELRKDMAEFYRKVLKDGLDAANLLNQDIYHAYAKVRLHFKPDDLSFSRIENKFEFCMSKVSDLKAETDVEKLSVTKEQIHNAANEITAFSRGILKAEWETVKLGEPAYKQTKKWSIWICVVMFFILLTIGTHAAISYSKAANYTNIDPTRGALHTSAIEQR